MLSGAMLGILEEAGTAVLTLSEGLEEEEFFATRLTQQEVSRQIRTIAQTAVAMPEEVKLQLAEIDWAAWSALETQFSSTGGLDRDALWFGVRSLVPAMLMWMRVYRHNQPELFTFTA
jgi:uncharacterized protein with HEPN domain